MSEGRDLSDTVWRIKEGLADAELDGERVVWDPASGQLARLDRIGSLIWASLDGVARLAEVSADLGAAFGLAPAVVRADIEDLVRQLSELGLVVEEHTGLGLGDC